MMRGLHAVLAFFALSVAPLAVSADVSRALLDIQERLYLARDGTRVFADATLYEPSLVDAFYQRTGYQPAWTDPSYAREMLELLASSKLEGLNPADYHHDEILALIAAFDAPWSERDALRAKAEVLLTDGILLYAKHLLQGKVDPRTLDDSWNYSRRRLEPADVARSLADALGRREVAATLEDLKIDTPFYRLMKSKLREYRERASSERFTPVPADTVLREGDRHPDVLALRRRLQELDYPAEVLAAEDLFDEGLAAAVRDFQRDNALEVDGIVGAQSFRVLNLSAEQRVNLLRINLDRVRWISQDMTDERLVVNIAGFELYYLRQNELVWQTPVMVGSIDTRTPIFRKRMRYLEFNPTWNVPRSLVVRSIYPRLASDPGYARAMGYRFFDARGEVDPATIDWRSYTGASFPYRVVQDPGPENAMGRVKFMFPNRHAVYLHDTPSRALFARSKRAFSAGCIRVKNPLELARLLLDDPDAWSAEKLSELVASGRPRQVVQMQRPVDVLLMYWTVSPEEGGRLEFHDDVYGLDPAALAALDAPPTAARFDG
jgi:murein L,D-transpeptidase YcbB/YkuD